MHVNRLHAWLALIGVLTMTVGLLLLVGFAVQGALVYASPGILYVALGGNCGGTTPNCYDTPQGAMDDALSGDEIRVAAGLYPIQLGSAQVVYVDKDLTIRGGYATDNWDAPDPETNATEFTALGQGRVMIISGTIEVTVEGLRLTYGDSDELGAGMPGGDSGGGLYILGATVTLRQNWLLNNTAPAGMFLGGGGLYARESIVTLEDNVIQGNYGSWGGGLLFSETEAAVQNCQIEGNEAGGMGSAGGGLAIIDNSDVTLIGNTIVDNDATFSSGTQGGGVFVGNGHATLIDNTIEGNYSMREAGGVGIGGGAVAVLTGNRILDNDGNGNGGGLTIGWPSAAEAVTLTHNTISGNNAVWGGGLYLENTQALLADNTFQDNQSYEGGGAHMGGSQPIAFLDNRLYGNVSGGSMGGGNGGGVYVATQHAVLARNVFQRNTAKRGYGRGGNGGGVAIGADCTLINNAVTDNTGETSGPGIAVFGAEPELYHNTIANNSGGDGSGLFVGKGGLQDEPGRPTLYNTIIASQTLGVKVSDDAPQNLATMYGVLWWANTDNFTGTVFAFDVVEDDPAFAQPANNDYHIVAGSAAINSVVTEQAIADDIDGQTRPHYAASDLGADEWWPLVAIKAAMPGTAEPGDVVTYTLTLSNATAVTMPVDLADELPLGVTYLGPLAYNNGYGSYDVGTIIWAGTVSTNTATVISWPVEVDDSASDVITNTALVTDAYGLFETDPALILVPARRYNIYLPLVVRNG
jgi:uncharacterized repeat protein (TIGR01451 family)